MLDAVIFDAAGTILENRVNFSPRKKAAELLGLRGEQQVRNLVYAISADQPGMTCQEFVDALVVRGVGRKDRSLARELTIAWEYYNSQQSLRSDAITVLSELRARGMKLALLPNCTPFFRPLCDEMQLQYHFDAICLSSEIGYLKPDPRAFRIAMERMGSFPGCTCVVGDKVKTDILGGTLAGCKTILMETRCDSVITDDRLPLYAVVSELSNLLQLPIFARESM